MKFKKELLELICLHKIEFVLIFTHSFLFIIFDLDDMADFYRYFMYSGVIFVCVYICNSTKIYKFCPIFLSIFYLVLFVYDDFFTDFMSYDKILSLNLIFIFLLLFFPFYKDNDRLLNSSINTLSSVLFAGFLMIGTYILVCGLFISTSYLFDIRIGSDTYIKTFFVLFFALFATLFLYFNSIKRVFVPNVFFAIFFNIISGFLVIYSVLLYAYILYIIFIFELPRGMLSVIILPYLVVGFVFYFIRGYLNNKFNTFYKNFGFIALVPVVMLYIAILRRIFDYGFTPLRFYLLAVCVLVSIVCILILFKFRLRFICFAIISCVFISSFVLNSKEISINSQLRYFDKLLYSLDLLDSDRQIKNEDKLANVDKKQMLNLKNIAYNLYKLNKNSVDRYNIIYKNGMFSKILYFNDFIKPFYRYNFNLKNGSIFKFDRSYKSMAFVRKDAYSDFSFIVDGAEIKFNGNDFIAEVFKSNNLDISNLYEMSELSRYESSFLQKEYDEGILFFTTFVMTYDDGKYKFLQLENIFFVKK